MSTLGWNPRLFTPYPVAFAAVAIGTTLLAAAVPTAVSELLAVPGNDVLDRLQHEQTVGEYGVKRLVRSREAAGRWRQTASGSTELALGRLILHTFRGSDPDVPAHVEALLTQGLSLRPMDPYGWMRLTQVRLAQGAPTPEVASSLRLALLSGPHEDRRHAMLLLTVEAGLTVWDKLDGSDRALIGEKVRKAWSRDPRRTAAAAVRSGRTEVLADLLGL